MEKIAPCRTRQIQASQLQTRRPPQVQKSLLPQIQKCLPPQIQIRLLRQVQKSLPSQIQKRLLPVQMFQSLLVLLPLPRLVAS